ncbi:MAG: hypothetical protein OEV10_09605 [Gammaproteobacteria bacterium]|jgi:hypothetical protein|nr:hypothetical protein [Gammaproteobacteria bacterium]MDH3864207.1 hypothetical protein [Gammaproteobacteria bacterium]MDH3906957.1 hypothetical protein [Gammaproteobacteria bacterium]MDH3952769.1 hypothetical protein [Gammaproteobacteria bacterium]MDH4005984.1 hypothetical protein [Gammaproteobacteria bacterium]
MTSPLILYVPGLLPKPEAGVHKQALRRCLAEGLRRHDEGVGKEFDAAERSFDLVGWTYDFYREHRDFALDAKSIDDLLNRPDASEQDIVEASSLGKRLLRWLYRVGNLFPFLIPHLASERVELHLRDLMRYAHNRNDIAAHTREMLKMPLRAAWESGRPVLLAAHSMGSVIAYDVLWEMSRDPRDELQIDLLLTMGSPLGQGYLQRRILGHDESGRARYPCNIRRWVNLSAVGDMTAVNPCLGNDFGEMVELGLVECIEDIEIFNFFRHDGELNVHAEYGYLVNKVTAAVVADWWRQQQHAV